MPITLNITPNEWTCLLGPSGVGKTTVLREIAALETAVDFDGSITTSDNKPLNDRVAYMAQSDLLFPWLSVLDNICIGAKLRGQSADFERATKLLDRVGLSDHKSKKPKALSGGQRQRVALARTLMEDRPVILLDEPFSALDAKTRAEMQELSAELLKSKTVLLVTHDPAEAARLGHSVYVMQQDGLQTIKMPSTSPIRATDDADTLTTQGVLFRILRGQVI
ncbi:ABC transporter ATP-binding protein [Amylibacter sp. SFDW26]|nr:ABC transporter ATP-binding protein [Amylibacter sp. SFDW26]KAB7613990.1 ABC transporter ATP-binding protein [Amylibacter sp. SFDW26]